MGLAMNRRYHGKSEVEQAAGVQEAPTFESGEPAVTEPEQAKAESGGRRKAAPAAAVKSERDTETDDSHAGFGDHPGTEQPSA